MDPYILVKYENDQDVDSFLNHPYVPSLNNVADDDGNEVTLKLEEDGIASSSSSQQDENEENIDKGAQIFLLPVF